jgi:uncharacterized protein YraI
LFAALLLALLAGGTARPTRAADASWRASYYNNIGLTGAPVVVRDEASIDYTWGETVPAAPGVNLDNFSVRWTRNVDFGQAGIYRFTARMDDGMRVLVDGVAVLDDWIAGPPRTIQNDRYFNAGAHYIEVQYFDVKLHAEAHFSYQYVGPGNPTINNWRGDYFNNTNLSGNPVVVRDDAGVNFNWGSGSPVPGIINSDSFSVRWTRTMNFTSGRYLITAVADDGIRVWINNQLLIDQWRDQNVSSFTTEATLPGGALPVRIDYYEHGGGAIAQVSWTPIAMTINNWRGEYFANRYLAGNPAVIRDDAAVDFNWGDNAPMTGLDKDNFSVRWTRTLALTPGRYRFTVATDDGVRLWVNNQLLVDRWQNQALTTAVGEIDLGSSAPVRMEYFDQNGFAEAHLSWTQVSAGPNPNVPPTPVPLPGQATAKVNANALNVRSAPGIGNTILTVVHRDEIYPLAGYRNAEANWVMIKLPSGAQGWVHANYVITSVPVSSLAVWAAPPAPTPAPSGNATVSTYHLNMRSGPGISYTIITVLDLGQTMTLLGRNSAASWVRIALPSGAVGWVHANYLTTTVPITSLPVVG